MVDARSDGTNTAIDTTDLESPADHSRETVIPLFEEELSVSRRVVPTSRVQVSRVTHSHEHLVDELLERERVEVERVAIDKPIDRMPSVREEGDCLIFPVVEEVLKIERVLVLKEEVRIRRVKGTERYQERVTLRKQEAVVNRLPIDETTAEQANHREVSDAKENI
jgi:stress response protein YsnF